jgi:hypothetical protein
MRDWLIFCALSVLVLLGAGCNKAESAAPAPEPAAVAINTVPSQPVPAFSAAKIIGMFVYPKNNQNHDQQLIDESECYNSVQQQTGIDLRTGAPKAPTSAHLNATEQQGAANAPQEEGGHVRGATRRAAGAAAIGGASQEQQAYGQSKAAYNQQIATFKRGFTACMDARGYSVN